MFILGWLARSARDGRITQDELVALVEGAVQISGLKVRIDVPRIPPEFGPPEFDDVPGSPGGTI